MLPSVMSRFLTSRHITNTAKLIGMKRLRNCERPEVTSSCNVIICRLMAGHSKWQNIKHIKAEKDKQRSVLHGKYSHMIRIAVREKGPDPKSNAKLAEFIEQARKHNVASSVVENAIKKAATGKVKSGLIEILGPGGCYLIVDYETDSISETRHKIKYFCKRYKSSLPAGEGRWRAFYSQKGIVKVIRSNDDEALDAEKALDIAIEAGAEDVQLKTGDDDAPFLEFYCEPTDLFKVKKEIEKFYYVEEAYIGFIANITVELSDSDMDLTSSFLADLAEMPEIVRIYENVQ